MNTDELDFTLNIKIPVIVHFPELNVFEFIPVGKQIQYKCSCSNCVCCFTNMVFDKMAIYYKANIWLLLKAMVNKYPDISEFIIHKGIIYSKNEYYGLFNEKNEKNHKKYFNILATYKEVSIGFLGLKKKKNPWSLEITY